MLSLHVQDIKENERKLFGILKSDKIFFHTSYVILPPSGPEFFFSNESPLP